MQGAREFARPVPLTAVLVLVVNDHVLKTSGVLPGWLTGKLSDVAGLLFFPVFLFALRAAFAPVVRRLAWARACAALSAMVFVAIKLSPACNAGVNALLAAWDLGSMRLDPTDLLALPATLGALLVLRSAPVRGGAGGVLVERAGLLLAALASVGTSRATHGYPFWHVEDPAARARGESTKSVGCARVVAEVVRSGKEGIGVMVVDHSAPECRVHLTQVVLRFATETVHSASISSWDPQRTTYVPLPFDNQRAWNDGVRSARLSVEIEAASGDAALERGWVLYPLLQSYAGKHAITPMGPWPVPAPAPMLRAVTPADAGVLEALP